MQKVTFYVWLCDQHTKQQQISTVEAYKVLMNLVSYEFWGGTIHEWQGFYTHDDWSVVVEKSLIVSTIFDGEQSKVDNFVSNAKKALNQESVLVEYATVENKFL